MTDPRERLDRGTLTRVKTKLWTGEISLFPRTTQTPLDQQRLVKIEGLYQPQDQSPVTEGELVILHLTEYGERTAQAFVAVEINGALEWRDVMKRRRVRDTSSGGTW